MQVDWSSQRGHVNSTSNGFTLVELAVAVMIVGLLIGGVLTAKRFRANADIAATIMDVNAYGAATAAFVDRYGGLPGDLREAASRLPGCTDSASCEADRTASSTGDGHVGLPGRITRHQTGTVVPAERETVLFWAHLQRASFLRGVTDADGASDPTNAAWGQTHPTAPIGGGFHVKDSDGGTTDPLPGWPPGAQQPAGTFLVLQPAVAQNLVPVGAGSLVLDAATAARIDRKMDDGDPFDGYVVGYGTVTLMFTGAGCFAWTAVDRGRYDEPEEGGDCGLAFRIGP